MNQSVDMFLIVITISKEDVTAELPEFLRQRKRRSQRRRREGKDSAWKEFFRLKDYFKLSSTGTIDVDEKARREPSTETRRRKGCEELIVFLENYFSTHPSTGTIDGDEEAKRVRGINCIFGKLLSRTLQQEPSTETRRRKGCEELIVFLENYFHAPFNRNHRRRRGDEKRALKKLILWKITFTHPSTGTIDGDEEAKRVRIINCILGKLLLHTFRQEPSTETSRGEECLEGIRKCYIIIFFLTLKLKIRMFNHKKIVRNSTVFRFPIFK
ncbi:hypothetical protein JTE90_007533 [Oedothorax gibbosus]|uniref:Uncharacterized protein n=1 Tax=Oedothorax gibbosus TaxID=931172 RepID=A0AAV6VKW2_9ARAC|nr:hypothetical protein JTE90_007533 [Oedothorax gibbosus]